MEVGVDYRVRTAAGPGGPLLALDTSTDRASIALGLPDGSTLLAPVAPPGRHGRGLVGSIRDLLISAGVRPRDLAAIAVGLGPGSFTGLRIGLTAAKTLAYAAGSPLYGLDSLEAIAAGSRVEALLVVAIGDAQRGDVFSAEFAREATGGPLRRVGPTRVEPAATLGARLPAGAVVIGPPLGRSEPTWPPSIDRSGPGDGYPVGPFLLALARARVDRGPPDDPWFLEPIYARGSAAEEKVDGPSAVGGVGHGRA